MEIKITQNNFPHSKNIKDILQNTSILDVLGDIDFYFGGGFTVALMYAPRNPDNNLLLSKKYYSDVDLFFKDQESLNEATSILDALRSTNKLRKVCESENAITYDFYAFSEGIPFPEIYNLQLIKKYTGTPSQILSTFDILNSI